MKKILHAILNILEAGGSAFLRYPVSIICAFGVAVTLSITLQTNGNVDDKLVTCLLISFTFGAVLNATIVIAKERAETYNILGFILDFIGIVLPIAIFLILFLPYDSVPEMVLARVIALIIICAVLFILVPSYKNEKLNYNCMVFMLLKNFFVSFIYCLVILLGLFFVAFTVESLLYSNMDEKIYGHIAIFTGFILFSLFLGLMPSFKKDAEEKEIEAKARYPRFIEVLLSYIIIPILVFIFVIIAIWSAKILWWRNWPEFSQFNFIFSFYLLFGIFIFILVSQLNDSFSRFYRVFFPITSLPLLILQAYNIYKRVSVLALTDSRYFLILIWLFCTCSIVVFLIRPIVKNYYTSIFCIILSVIAVLPFFNYRDLSVYTQVFRAEILLKANNMLEAGSIKHTESITTEDKEAISDAVLYITTRGKASMAPWLNEKFDYNTDFKNVFGFEQHNRYNYPDNTGKEKFVLVGNLSDNYYTVADYNILVIPPEAYLQGSGFSIDNIKGRRATYAFQLLDREKNGINVPVVVLKKNGKVIIEQDLYDNLIKIQDYLSEHDDESAAPIEVPPDIMTVKLSADNVELMIVFKTINIYISSDTNINDEYNIIADNILISG